MTTQKAATAKTDGEPGRNPWRQMRHLWQVPTFLTGVLVFIAVGASRPLWSAGVGHGIDRTLAQAHKLLNQPRPDLDEVQTLLTHVLAELPSESPLTGEAQFLLGSTLLRRAEQAPANGSIEFWRKAVGPLETAECVGVPEADRRKLAFRLAKVYTALEGDPQRIIDRLNFVLPDGADDPFEGYGLLAQAYLRLTPADLARALEATKQQLALPNPDESALAAPRLQCGKLLLKLDQTDEAARVLARIGPGAPADLLAQARALRAKVLTDAGAWSEAVLLWEQLRDDTRSTEPSHVFYSLGLCYKNLGQKGKAARAWEEAMKLGGEEGQAAALRLADLRLRGDNVPAAFEAFEVGLHGVTSPTEYRNTLFTLADARNLFEEGCRWYRQMGQYEASQHLAGLYEKLAPDGGAQELAGLAAEAWAHMLLEQAQHGPTLGNRHETEEALKKLQEAGRAFETAAVLSKAPAEQADWYWRSAENYRQGLDATSTVHVLERYVRLSVAAERQGEAWYALGEAHRSLRHDALAEESYKRCIQYPGPYGFRARCQLATNAIAQRRLDDAEVMLNQYLELLTSMISPDAEAHERTLVALASLLFDRHNYRDAFVRLQEAMERYPANPNALKLRWQFAQCCRQLADQMGQQLLRSHQNAPTEQAHYRTQQLRFLDMAAANSQKLADDLTARLAERPLTPEEDRVLREASFSLADCRFQEGQFDDSLRQYEILAARYRNQVDGLIALRNVWRCYGVKLQAEKARETLERIRTSLKEMPAPVFDGESEIRTRRYWDEWLGQKGREGV
jgi:Tfp pilus assembly protein PilF